MFQKKFNYVWLFFFVFNFIKCNEIDDTLELMLAGDQAISVDRFNEAVLVLGYSGSGKSILTKFIADLEEELSASRNSQNQIVIHHTHLHPDIIQKDNKFSELVVDRTTNIPYFNGPVFSDSDKTFTSDVASTYFIYKAISSTKKLKIIFVLDDMSHFDQLLDYASNFIKDVTKFKNSIALILTKVEKNDVAQKSEIVKYLEDYKSRVNSDNSRNFINSLLDKSNINYNKIGVFIKPTTVGNLHDLPDMEKNKNELKDLVKNLEYAEWDNFDYSFLYKKWGTQIQNAISKINENKINEINQKVERYFNREERRFGELEIFKNQLDEKAKRMANIIESLNEISDPTDAERKVLNYLYEIIVEVPNNLVLYSKISEFLRLTNPELKKLSLDWIRQLKTTNDYLQNLDNKFKVFYLMFEGISLNQSHARILYKETVQQLNNQNLLKGKDLNNWKSFLQSVNITYGKYFANIAEIDFNRFELDILKRIVSQVILNDKMKCEADTITVKGNYIRLSDVLNYIEKIRNSNKCKFKKVYIFAYNTFDFDTDFGSGLWQKQAEIAIISPVWRSPWDYRIEFGKRGDSNDKDVGGAVLIIGGEFDNGKVSSILSRGGEINNFGPLYHPESDVRPCGGLDNADFSPEYCKSGYTPTMSNPNGYKFPNKNQLITQYKEDMIKNFKYKYQRSTAKKFLESLSKLSNTIVPSYTNVEYTDELKKLENLYGSYNDKSLFKPLYENLLERIGESISKTQAPEQKKDLYILKYLYSAILSKVVTLNNDNGRFIVDIPQYLDFTIKNINLLTSNRKDIAVKKIKSQYLKTINEKIEEGSKFIQYHIEPRIKELEKHIIKVVRDDLIDEIVEVQQALEAKREEIKARIWQTAISGVLGVLGTICSVLAGPVGIALSIGATVLSSIDLGDTSTKMHQIPADLENKVASLNNYVKQHEDLKWDNLKQSLDYLKLEGVHDPVIDDLYQKSIANEKIESDKSFELFNSVIDNKVTSLEVSDPTSPKIQTLKSAKSLANAANIGAKVTADTIKTAQKVIALNDMLEENEQQMKNLAKLKETVSKTFVPLLKNMTDDLNEKLKGLKTQSKISLKYKQWLIKESLTDLSIQMQGLTNGFQVQAEILQHISKLGQAIDLVIGIYDAIQDYEEQKVFADFIHDITHSPREDALIAKEEGLVALKEDLDLIIQENVVLQNYENVISSLKQYVFPFAKKYIEQDDKIQVIDKNDNRTTAATRVSAYLTNLKSKLDGLYSTLTLNDDKYIKKRDFYNTGILTPFYVWRNDEYRDIIKELLDGKRVVLKADITSSTRNAVKFRTIDLIFKSDYSSTQTYLNNVLKNFEVNITHMGNSYYKCDDKIYVVPTESVPMDYGPLNMAIENGIVDANKNIPTSVNKVYDTLKTTNFFLSPYAVWSIQLISLTDIAQFEKFGDLYKSVSLELSGKGEFLLEGSEICKQDLESFYNLDTNLFVRSSNLLV